jgi:hypothetical protein
LTKAHAIFEIVVGAVSCLFLLSMLGGMASMTTISSVSIFLLAWGALFLGPILLIVGSSVFLLGLRRKLGVLINICGALAWTGLAVYVAVSARTDALERGRNPWVIGFSIVVVCVSVLVDWAAYFLWRAIRSDRHRPGMVTTNDV